MGFKKWPRKWKVLFVLLVLIYIGLWGVAGFVYAQKLKPSDEGLDIGSLINKNIIPEAADFANPITGVLYTQKEAAGWKNRVPLGIMVENSTLARPQSGLSRAEVVYEALAEGDITRFAAIFLSQSGQVGPVRSAREYYYDWIMEYGAAYGHWGGNEYTRSLARQLFGSKDFDQFAIGSGAYYRLGSGEHSGYTHTDKLWSIADQRRVNKLPVITSWKFKDDNPSKAPNASQVDIGFAGAYGVGWRYDAALNAYKRLNGGASHVDKETDQQLTVKNVIAQFIVSEGYKQVTPGVSNRVFQTIGSGRVLIFSDGTVSEGTWKKDSRESRTKFLDKDGQEIALNRGQIWVDMVPNGFSVNFR